MTPRFDQRSLHKFERRTDEIRDLHAARIGQAQHAARILTADLARHQGNRGSAVAQRNPNILFDLRHPSRQRHGFDNARCSQNREAADDPQTRVESFTRNRFTTETADEHIKAWISMARSLAWPRWRCCASLPYQCTGSKG